jgi:hypothetical protein
VAHSSRHGVGIRFPRTAGDRQATLRRGLGQLERAAMSAVEALQAARAAGISVRIDGDGLVLEASAPPPCAVLDPLSRHKAGLSLATRAALLLLKHR